MNPASRDDLDFSAGEPVNIEKLQELILTRSLGQWYGLPKVRTSQ